jgi:predicted nicotinamide N-methyase
VTDPAVFIRRNTAIVAPPLVPEIRLHLATEVTPLWEATEETLAQGAVPPPYWAFAWAGGQALARYLLDHPEMAAGRDVLDFGAGSGLVAIAAAKAGARSVTAAEIDPFAAAAIAANAALNGVSIAVVTSDLSDGDTRVWKLVTAGDICYEQPMAERAMRWLRLLAGRGSTVLLGDPGRAHVPGGGLCELARYEVPTSRELEGRERCDGFVWRILPR